MSAPLLPGRSTVSCPAPCEVPAMLQAEIARLREALTTIRDYPIVERNPDGDNQTPWTVQLIARDALGGN